MSTYTDLIKNRGNSEASDECYSPIEICKTLLRFLDKNKTYYEATSGKSNSLVKGFRELGFKIEGSGDKDFFETTSEDVFDAVITNPPFSKKDRFLEHCYQIGKPFALLLPVTSFQGQKRGKMFIEKGISALVLNRRVDFTGKKAPTFGVAWFMGNGFAPNGRLYFEDN